MMPPSARGAVPPRPATPATHYELFAGLREAGVRFLVTGAVALVLHGVPRLTPDLDLLIDPEPGNTRRLEGWLAAWGYAEAGPGETAAPGVTVRRFRNPAAALDEIDVVLLASGAFERLAAGAAAVALVDASIPVVGAADLRALKAAAPAGAGREDAEGLDLLSARGAHGGGGEDTRLEQIRKFSRWSIAARLDWLLAAARLRKGLSPESRPMTRGLVRRRGWYGG